MHRTRLTTLAALAGIRPHRGPLRRDDPSGSDTTTGSGSSEAGSAGSGGDPGDDSQDSKAGPDGDTGSKTPTIDGDLDKDRAARTIAAAREAEKKAKDQARTAAREVQDLKDKLAIALGLKPDPKTDPKAIADQAAKELADAKTQIATMKAENALARLAGKTGGDLDALRDSRTFMTKLGEIDAEASDYDDQVTAAIKAAVKTNPRLGTAPAGPSKQGADHSGSGGSRPRSRDLTSAVARKLGG